MITAPGSDFDLERTAEMTGIVFTERHAEGTKADIKLLNW
jgi:hypothetical protein